MEYGNIELLTNGSGVSDYVDICADVPNLGSLLAVPTEGEDVPANLKMVRHRHWVEDMHSSIPVVMWYRALGPLWVGREGALSGPHGGHFNNLSSVLPLSVVHVLLVVPNEVKVVLLEALLCKLWVTPNRQFAESEGITAMMVDVNVPSNLNHICFGIFIFSSFVFLFFCTFVLCFL